MFSFIQIFISNFCRIYENVAAQDEPKYIVFQLMLIMLFSMFCFKCHQDKPSIEMSKNGTMVTVIQKCKQCRGFTWTSQPLVLGRYPAGNIMLNIATLASGSSISKVLLLLRHLGLSCYKTRTFFVHHKKFLFPTILAY